MDIDAIMKMLMTDEDIKKLVVVVLQEVLDAGHELGGMGEYGRGWNDRGMSVKMIVKEKMKEWSV